MTEALVSSFLADGGIVVAAIIFAGVVISAVAVLSWRAGVVTASIDDLSKRVSEIMVWVKEHEQKCTERTRDLHRKIDGVSDQLNRLIGRSEK